MKKQPKPTNKMEILSSDKDKKIFFEGVLLNNNKPNESLIKAVKKYLKMINKNKISPFSHQP